MQFHCFSRACAARPYIVIVSNPNLFFIHNPHSRHGQRANAVRELRETRGKNFVWAETSAPGHATELAREAAMRGVDTIIAVGGDGTTHEVVNGLMQVAADVRPKLGILPVGTGNDFAFAAGIPSDPQSAFDAILAGDTMLADIGSMENRTSTQYWMNSIGIGFDAKVIVRGHNFRRIKGEAVYPIATLAELLLDHTMMDVELSFNDHRMAERLLMLTIGNGPREGGGFYTTPDSKIDDGRFEMFVVRPLSRLRMLRLLPRILKPKQLDANEVSYHSFSDLSLRLQGPAVIHMDGEISLVPEGDSREMSVRMHHHALRVCTTTVHRE